MIEFNCGHCGKLFRVRDDFAGRQARCQGCGNPVWIPGGASRTPMPAPAPVPRSAPARSGPSPRNIGMMSPARPLRGYHPTSEHSPLVVAGVILLIVASLAVPGGFAVYRYRTLKASQANAASNAGSTSGSSTSGGYASSSSTSGSASSSGASSGASAATPAGPPPVVPFTGTPEPIFPERPKPTPTADADVDVYPMDITGKGRGLPMHVQLYLPKGTHATHSLPCVFIAPAGTRLIHGSALTESDTVEHLPYAHAGFAVMAYELSGDFRSTSDPFLSLPAFGRAIQEFMAADGGVANAKWAIEYVLKKVPEVNPDQLYAAGHSSAGTMALNLAAAEPRIRGVAAYAPACDVYDHWRLELKYLAGVAPGIYTFVHQVSPEEHLKDIHCPLFLFYADDDDGQMNADIRHFAGKFESAGGNVKVMRVKTGGHYQAMIDQGIPAGIAWLKDQEGAGSPATQESGK